jgi:peroxiredoxin
MKPDTDPQIPPRTFTWSPPEGWRQWTPPSPERFLLPAGSEAPDFELRSAGRGTVSLSDCRGQVVWLYVWQVGSLDGREQMRYLQSLHDKYGDKGLAIVGFNCVDDRRIAQTFLRDSSVTFPTVLDSAETARRVVSVGLESRALDRPLSCIIDREGKIVDAWYGSEKSKRRGAAAFKDVGLEVEME